MRKRLAAWAARGIDCARAINRGLLLALALGTAATVLGAPADISRGLTWLQSRVQADGSLLGQPNDGGQQLVRCETAATLIKLAGNSSQVASLLAALQSPDGVTETLACRQQLHQQLGEAILTSDVELRRVAQQGYAAYAAFGESSTLDTGWALAAQLQNLGSADRAAAIAWLQANQQADGSFATAGKADILATGVILRGLRQQSSLSADAATISSRAASYLLGKVSPQGDWLDDTATTALLFEAVHPYSAATPTLAHLVEAYLLGKQQGDGSWAGDAYTTAVALRALALTSVTPLDPTRAGLKVKFIDARVATAVPGVRLESTNPAVSALADGGGLVQLANLQPGAYQLTASLGGYATVNISASLVAGQTLDLGVIQLVPPSSPTTAVISGTVREQGTNLPIPGATVTVEGQGLSALTAPDGNYLISSVAPGTVTLSATRSGYLAASANAAALAGQAINFSPWLSPDPGNTAGTECKVTGTVLDAATLQPLAGASISLTGSNNVVVTTDAAGRYSTANLVSGLITAKASKTGYDNVTATTQLVCSNTWPTVLDFSPRLYASGQTPAGGNSAGLSGVVMDAATNQPIAGAQLVATPSFGTPKTTQSAPDGTFLLTGLDGATAQLQVQASGYEGVTVSYALAPLQTIDLGQVRLRAPRVQQLMPDLKVLTVSRATARTDAQTLQLQGAVDVVVGNGGTQLAPANVSLLAFDDSNRNDRWDAGVDRMLGQATLTPSLVPGQTATVSVSVAGILGMRDGPVHVVVDPQQQIADANRTNNQRATSQDSLLTPGGGALAPVLKWHWTGIEGSGQVNQVSMSPVVGRIDDTNGDGVIDAQDRVRVIFSAYPTSGQHSNTAAAKIVVVDGETGVTQRIFGAPPENFGIPALAGIALADLDMDGKPEIITMSLDHRVLAFRGNGTFFWRSARVLPQTFKGYDIWATPSVADLDGDGIPEVIVSKFALKNDGSPKWTGTGEFWGGWQTPYPPTLNSSVVSSLYADGQQNVIVGAGVYDALGNKLWEAPAIAPTPPAGASVSRDGYSAVGRFGADTQPSIVVVSRGFGLTAGAPATFLTLYDKNGQERWRVSVPSGGGGPPTLADADGDGELDIGVAGAAAYSVFRSDGSLMWSTVVDDRSSFQTGSTFFDFQGDGSAEVLYADERNIRVMSGATGNVLWSMANPSITGLEYPVVADIDADGRADFLAVANNHWFPGVKGVRAFKDASNAWVGTRSVWNQHAYSITNINDDLSVPRNPAPAWSTHNTFRLNKRLEADPRAAADATVGYTRVQDNGAQPSNVTWRVGNAGSYPLSASVKLAFYATRPQGTTELLGTTTLPQTLQPGQSIDITRAVASLGSYATLTAVVDDDGAGNAVSIDFDRSNNAHSVDVRLIAANVTIGVAADRPSYTEADLAVFSASVVNSGSFQQQVQVRFTVLDATGQVTDVLPLSGPLATPVGATTPMQALWPVTGVLSGNYQLLAELVTSQGLVYGSATTSFTVSASQAQASSTRINADRLSYTAAQTVQVFSRVANLTANATQDSVQAFTSVRGASGQEVFSHTESIGQLAAGAQLQYNYPLPAAGLAAGSYQASLELRSAQGTVLSQSTTSFSVQGTDQSGVGLTGQLQATPNPVFLGAPLALNLSASNSGNTALAGVPVTSRILDPQSGAVLSSFTQVVSAWPQGTAQNLSWTWTAQGLDGQTVLAIASASIAGRDIALGQATIRLVGVPQLRAQPAQLDFTPIYVGENASKTVTVSSLGSLAASSITFTLSGADASHYAIPQGGCTESASLPIGATCTLTISWRPQAAGNQAAEVRVDYANGEPLTVSLSGHAKPVIFTGTVQADPKEVEAGQDISLNYSVSNPATVTTQLAGSLSVQDGAGQTLNTWPLGFAVSGQASFAGNQPYTTGAQAQTLTVALSQQVGTSSIVLATDTFTVVDPPVPLGVGTGLKGQARILVLVSCPPGLGSQEDAACQAQRAQAITNYLHALGFTAKVVTTKDAFMAEMRCGTYNTYWLSGGAIKLDATTVGELREAVYRGEALWMDGVHDSRNHLLHPAAGVKDLGKLPTSDQAIAIGEGLYPAQSLPTLGQPGKFELTTGQAQALFTHMPGNQAPLPAIVSNDHGRGKSLLFAFDLAAMLTADATQANAQLRGFVTASASHAGSASPTLTVGDLTQLTASIGNLGTRTVAFRADAMLPAGLTSIATSPPAQLTANSDGTTQAIWRFSLPGGATQDIDWLVRASQAGSYSAPLAIYSLPATGSSLPPKLRASTAFTAEVKDAQILLQQAQTAVNALNPPASSDKSNKTKAVNAIAQALALHGQANYEQAIAQWLAAADALADITSADTTAARAAVALALEASTDALCIQRCGTAACQ